MYNQINSKNKGVNTQTPFLLNYFTVLTNTYAFKVILFKIISEIVTSLQQYIFKLFPFIFFSTMVQEPLR